MENKILPVDIANYYLENHKNDDINNIKINKLVYISYGWYYALHQKELFTECIQAWKYGPVIPSVYHTFKRYGFLNIEEPSYIYDFMDNKNILFPINKILKNFFKEIYKVYGGFSDRELIRMTHYNGTPWYEVYVNKNNEEKKFYLEIDRNLIQKYYTELKNETS